MGDGGGGLLRLHHMGPREEKPANIIFRMTENNKKHIKPVTSVSDSDQL